MYTTHTSSLSFKDNCLWSQVPTCAFTLACISDQFCSSWGLGLNYTLKMQIGLSVKDPGGGTPHHQAPNRRPSLLSKLILAPASSSYLSTAFFTVNMSSWWDTKAVISSPYTETFTLTWLAKGTPCRTGLAFSSLSLWSRGSKVRT